MIPSLIVPAMGGDNVSLFLFSHFILNSFSYKFKFYITIPIFFLSHIRKNVHRIWSHYLPSFALHWSQFIFSFSICSGRQSTSYTDSSFCSWLKYTSPSTFWNQITSSSWRLLCLCYSYSLHCWRLFIATDNWFSWSKFLIFIHLNPEGLRGNPLNSK